MILYSTDNCRQCYEAMVYLDDYNVKYQVKKITDASVRKELRDAHNTKTFPILVLQDGTSFSGSKEIVDWLDNSFMLIDDF